MTILQRIAETKRREIAAAKKTRPLARIEDEIRSLDPPRDFHAAVTAPSSDGPNVIAEIKKASPSAGLIVDRFDPVAIARIYAKSGAAALSVLTDETYFQGRLEFMDQVRQVVALPVLRKDFLLDPYQLYEARAAGADAVLLIGELVNTDTLVTLLAHANRLNLTALLEIHSEENLAAVLDTLGPPARGGYLLGINNRDLSVQKTDLSTMTRLAARLPAGTAFVAESGLATRSDVLMAQRAGACAVLVGESILRATDTGLALRTLLGR